MSNAPTQIAENDLLTTLEREESTQIDQLSQIAAKSKSPSLESIRRVDALLDNLDVQEFDVLQMLFGLDGQEPLSATAISLRSGLDAGQVEQLKNQALSRLRALSRPSMLMNEN